jgi:hypothetical protein
MEICAINPDYQHLLEFLYNADRKYCALVDKNQAKLDTLDPDSDKYYNAQERFEDQEARQYDRFHERLELNPLPKREIDAFTKSYVAFHGYTPYLV